MLWGAIHLKLNSIPHTEHRMTLEDLEYRANPVWTTFMVLFPYLLKGIAALSFSLCVFLAEESHTGSERGG